MRLWMRLRPKRMTVVALMGSAMVLAMTSMRTAPFGVSSSKHSLRCNKGPDTHHEPVARDAADHVRGRHPNAHSQGVSRSI